LEGDLKLQTIVLTRGNPRVECVEAMDRLLLQGFPVKYMVGAGSTAHLRSLAVHWFMTYCEAEKLLFIDDDISPHPDIQALADHDVDIVGAPYILWNPGLSLMPFDSAYKFCQGGMAPVPEGVGLVECDLVGGGTMCVKREVFEKVRPAFKEEFDNWGRRTVSEDFYFCREAKKSGFRVWVDFDLKCDHMKTVAVRDMITRIELSTRMWDAQTKEK
jgi:hypothetical protein